MTSSPPTAQHLRRHPRDVSHREDPHALGAGSAAAAQGPGARVGAASRRLSSTCRQTEIQAAVARRGWLGTLQPAAVLGVASVRPLRDRGEP